jgi:hypothetical protein
VASADTGTAHGRGHGGGRGRGHGSRTRTRWRAGARTQLADADPVARIGMDTDVGADTVVRSAGWGTRGARRRAKLRARALMRSEPSWRPLRGSTRAARATVARGLRVGAEAVRHAGLRESAAPALSATVARARRLGPDHPGQRCRRLTVTLASIRQDGFPEAAALYSSKPPCPPAGRRARRGRPARPWSHRRARDPRPRWQRDPPSARALQEESSANGLRKRLSVKQTLSEKS